MGPIIALIIIAGISLLTVRVGSVALMMTGLSWDAATFQAYSAFFGVGFTTREAEMVVNHPIRRKIILFLIVVGNLGITSALATLVVTFVRVDPNDAGDIFVTLGLIALGGAILFLICRIGFLRRILDFLIHRGLEGSGMVRILDYELLLRVQSGFCISEVEITEENPIAGSRLGESRPADRGIIVLGVTREDGRFLGAPGRHELIQAGDVLIVYGRENDVKMLAQGGSAKEDSSGGSAPAAAAI